MRRPPIHNENLNCSITKFIHKKKSFDNKQGLVDPFSLSFQNPIYIHSYHLFDKLTQVQHPLLLAFFYFFWLR